MKFIVLFLAISCITFSYAQDHKQLKAETPKIVTKLQFNAAMQFADISIKLVKIVTDSRCPKNVNCVWAGEAIVLVDVFKNGKKIKQKKLVFNTATPHLKELPNIFSSETLNITGYNLVPYPVYGKKIEMEEYCILLDIGE